MEELTDIKNDTAPVVVRFFSFSVDGHEPKTPSDSVQTITSPQQGKSPNLWYEQLQHFKSVCEIPKIWAEFAPKNQ